MPPKTTHRTALQEQSSLLRRRDSSRGAFLPRPRWPAPQAKLLEEADAQGAEIERLFADNDALAAAADEWRATAGSFEEQLRACMAQNRCGWPAGGRGGQAQGCLPALWGLWWRLKCSKGAAGQGLG